MKAAGGVPDCATDASRVRRAPCVGTSLAKPPAMAVLELSVVPLDAIRSAALRFATRSQVVTSILGRRDTRIAVLGGAQVLFLLGLTVRWPIAMYFIGPLVLGVVHLAADVRYLAFRLTSPRGFLAASAVVATLLTVARVCVGVHAATATLGARIDMGLGLLWVALALVLRFRDSPRKLALAAPAFLGAAASILSYAQWVDLALVHLHNVGAFVMWFALYRRRPGWAVVPAVLAAVAAAFLLSGVYLPWTAHHGGLTAFGQRATHLSAGFAPGLASHAAMAVTTTLVFLQSVHYAVWTGWIPQDCLRGEGTPTFRMTVRSLRADFGTVALALIACCAIGFASLACWHLRQSVSWYMTLARAHVWFEIAALAYFVGRADVTVLSRAPGRGAPACTLHIATEP